MKDYIERVLKTESNDYEKMKQRLATRQVARLIHASLGMQTESAEFADALKKFLAYGKEIDRINLLEELGDNLWYIAIALDELGSCFDEIMRMNIKKLEARYGIKFYGTKFSERGALDRDLNMEEQVLNEEANITTLAEDIQYTEMEVAIEESGDR